MTRPDYWKECTTDCEARQVCVVCGMRKNPVGRSAPVEMANGLCDHECEGYYRDPKPGHLWPGEIAQMDRHPENEDD